MAPQANELIVCHVDSDCQPGEICVPTTPIRMGDAPLNICVRLDE